MRPCLAILSLLLLAAPMAAAPAGFLESLSPERKKELGLDRLTAAQMAAINDAVDQYQGRENTKVLTQKAAAAAVEEYKAKQEPAAVRPARCNPQQTDDG